MSDRQLLHKVLGSLFDELVKGAAPKAPAFMLNPGDPGLLASLEKLSAAQASAPPAGGGASIAAHVDHLRYGFELCIRWSRGENPFADADYAGSWQRGTVSEEEWKARLEALHRDAATWRTALQTPRELDETELSGYIGSIAHLAYHVGAIRQINRAARGPLAND